MRALVTGASGFVGRYLVDALRREGVDVFACGGPHDAGEEHFRIDLADPQRLRAALDAARPTVVFHLAAQTFVPESVASPLETYEVNALGSARLAEAVRAYAAEPPPRIVFASSAEVYGAREPSDFPLREALDLRPANPYGASKAAAEAMLLAQARSFGLDVVVARAFNHIGPGQNERFVVASLAGQLARIAAGAPPSSSSATWPRRAIFSTYATSLPHTSRSRAAASARKFTTSAAVARSLFATCCAS